MKNVLLAIAFATMFGGAVVGVAAPGRAMAACNDYILTLPSWHRHLTEGDDCHMKSPESSTAGITKYIWTIVLNIVEFILQLVGYLSVGMIIFGGFKYIISTGTPDRMTHARNTILNAVVGLAISIFSVAIVNLVAGAIQ